MNSAQQRRRGTVKQRPAAGPLRLWLRRLYRPLVRRLRRWPRRTYRGRRSIDEKRIWRRNRPLVMVVRLVTYIGAVIFILWVLMAFMAVFFDNSLGIPLDLDRACEDTGFSCDALAGTLGPVLSLALASAVFLLFRLWYVRRPFLRKARENPRELVTTAGSIIDEVVGRDELCHVMIEDLRDRTTRRPHVVVGGVGAGKTALLVRLTKLLAERGAVPVPVRLRDAQDKLDFRDLARQRFLADADAALLSETEGEKVWRQLLKDDRVVVLADGLEEALIEGEAEKERDTHIRLAIRRANANRLPLIVASRPHDPLREMEAAIVELEPLSEEAALEYVQRRDSSEDEHRLDWIVETADVAEAPLYLQITRQLHRAGLMEYVSPSRDERRLDTRSVDRTELRLRLLDTWTGALVSGHFPAGLAMGRRDREATIEQLSVLACIGLRQDRLDVKFDDFFESLQARHRPAVVRAEAGNAEPRRLPIIEEVERRLGKLHRRFDIRLAAARGAQLGLVDARWDGVRFQHSIIQSYLGSRLIDVALADPRYLEEALQDPGPGREFLIALVMRSRAKARAARPNGAARVRIDTASPGPEDRSLQQVLAEVADGRNDAKVLDLYAAALEIDSVDPAPMHGDIAKRLQEQWSRISARDPRTLREAKFNLVRRFGEAARTIVEQRVKEPDYAAEPAYRQLYRIGCWESFYPIRLAAAEEIGAGGDQAFAALKDVLGPDKAPDLPADRPVPHAWEPGDGKPQAQPPADSRRADDRENEERRRWWRKATRTLKDVRGRHETPGLPADRSVPDVNGSGNRSDASWWAAGPRGLDEDQELEERRAWWEKLTRAWLAPLLVGSVTTQTRGQARKNLEQWLEFIRRQDRGPGEPDVRLSLEVALAQGFKYAANRRGRHPHAHPEARGYLAERAKEMLSDSRFWFSRLTLVQALCLWSLPDGPGGQQYGGQQYGGRQYGGQQYGRGRDADHRALVEHWAALPDGRPEHPFVAEARKLAVWALETGQPERFMWIDESGVLARVGSRPANPGSRRKHNLWIPPSTGWAALHPRAQQLVADVLLLLNLAERGERPSDSNRRLARTNRNDLPPCLAGDRSPLDPTRTVGMATTLSPGSNCKHGCPFELCPYPPKGEEVYRVELSEAFCRRQHALVSRGRGGSVGVGRKAAPWQGALPGDLRRFWRQMGQRAQPSEVGGERGRGRARRAR